MGQVSRKGRLLFTSCCCCCCCCVASVLSNSIQPQRQQPTRLLCPWNSSGKNTEVGSHSLLQGIFPTQGSNAPSPALDGILSHLNHSYLHPKSV